jgi:hypothetical protein
MSYAKLLTCAVVAASTAVACPALVVADSPEPLFTSAPEARGGPHARLPEALAGRQRGVRAARGALDDERLLLNLGVGPNLIAVRERIAEHRDGRKVWAGRVAGEADSEVVLAEVGQAMAGTIRHRGQLFRLIPGADGTQTLARVQTGDPLPSGHLAVPDLDLQALPDEPGSGSDGGTAQATGTETIIDILVAYSPEARTAHGGTDGIEALITLAVAEANQAYLNSAAPVQLRLVGALETAGSESGDMNTDIARLLNPTDGHMDQVLLERDALGADVVSLFVESGSYCGLGYQMAMLHSAYADYAFNVVKTSCATGYFSFAHEVGHNLGLSHDHDNATSGLFAYSYGHQDPIAGFRTVMAYDCLSGCSRVPHVSNPEVSYAGAPTGVLGYADNALALADTAPMVATWRESQVPMLPLSPTDLSASAQGHDRIDLAWSDTGALEDGYRIERSLDGASFTLIATLGADSVGFSDTGLAAETGYVYRVRAFNADGVAEPSNEAWATTEPAPVPVPEAPGALLAQAGSDSEIVLTWSDNATDETGFELERSTDAGNSWSLIATLAPDSVSYTDQDLEPATRYDYRLRATGNGDPSAYSASAGATTEPAPLYPPQAPVGLGAAAVSASEIALSWTDPAEDEDGFDIERSSDGGQSWSAIASLPSNAVTYIDHGLTSATFYLYRVRAFGQGGESAWSESAGAETLAPASACQVAGAASLGLSDKAATWTLSNTGAEGVIVSRIEVSWSSGQGSLRRLSLGGATIWRGSIAPTSADIATGWSGVVSDRELAAGQSEDLTLSFSRRYTGDGQDDYAITVHFAEGCSVSF